MPEEIEKIKKILARKIRILELRMDGISEYIIEKEKNRQFIPDSLFVKMIKTLPDRMLSLESQFETSVQIYHDKNDELEKRINDLFIFLNISQENL